MFAIFIHKHIYTSMHKIAYTLKYYWLELFYVVVVEEKLWKIYVYNWESYSNKMNNILQEKYFSRHFFIFSEEKKLSIHSIVKCDAFILSRISL